MGGMGPGSREQPAKAGQATAALPEPQPQPPLLGNERDVTFTAFSTVDFRSLRKGCLIALSLSSLPLSLPLLFNIKNK